jgi:hypothetical protein
VRSQCQAFDRKRSVLDGQSVRKHFLAQVREFGPSREPIDQAAAQLNLQRRQAAADGRLIHVKLSSRT